MTTGTRTNILTTIAILAAVMLSTTAIFAVGLGLGSGQQEHSGHTTTTTHEQQHQQHDQHDQHQQHTQHEQHEQHQAHTDKQHPLHSIDEAIAAVQATEGNDGVTGWVRFQQTGFGVRVTAHVEGLNPGQKHGFHVHEFGDLSAADGTAAGGHYNPEGHDHALPETDMARHAGDLGNLEADENGVAEYDNLFLNITIAGMNNPVLGRGIIVHAGTDDGSQPTGGAGARIGQGVIGVANPDDG